ncbi:hypothetical protein [Jatrophihabitans lederbergiae]|uniref:DUF2130 domain-containing protein n=1 Tax=Jatrophihabitans lederbergiae TaxID=3075547 RepID=A0ABU2JJB9_9ACTN|nr:hypothetical protein [Jatrophihabitans sp. DSM 44399]MDT0264338.1 hypothetical protein [Jatrophihabitans sp. DSM 44399]
MTAQLASLPDPNVYAVDGVVHIHDLASADPDLLTLVVGSGDAEAVVQRALSTGARALAIAQVSVDTAVVENSFATLETQLRSLLDDTTTRVTGTTADLLGHPEHGISATRRLLNPDADDSPLSRLLTGVRDQVATVLDAVGRLAEQITADKASATATAIALERSAVKGMAFEDQVVFAVTAITAERGDIAEAVGRLDGATGGRVGDIVVQVDPASIGGQAGGYVVECKDRRLTLKATLDELRRATENRDAYAAIAVFSGADNCPVPAPFAVFNDRAIVVYDKGDADPTALRLACAWARWIVQRESRLDHDGIDLDVVGRLIDEARRSLERVSTIRRAHSAAAKKIGEASGQVAELSAELTSVLNRIEQALASAAPADMPA